MFCPLFADRIAHPLQPGLNDRARHGKIQAHIPLRVADEEGIPTLEQHARFIGEEIRQVCHIRQTAGQIYSRQIGRLRNVHDCVRKLPSQKRLDKREVFV